MQLYHLFITLRNGTTKATQVPTTIPILNMVRIYRENPVGSQNIDFGYENADTIAGFQWRSSSGNGGGDDLFFNLTGYDPDASSETRIIELISPSAGEVTITEFVDIEYNYFFNDTTHFGVLDEACIDIINATLSQQLDSNCQTISSSGEILYSETVALSPNYTYVWRPYLTSSTTTVGRIYGDASWFSVVSEPETQSVLPPTNATSTPALQSWFGSVQQVILGVPPWSYWVQFRTIMASSTAQLTATSSLPIFVFPIGIASSTISFDQSLFDRNTMEAFIPESAWDVTKTAISFAVWVLFALMIYHEVDRRFSKPHS